MEKIQAVGLKDCDTTRSMQHSTCIYAPVTSCPILPSHRLLQHALLARNSGQHLLSWNIVEDDELESLQNDW
jgi:hypothetical protein